MYIEVTPFISRSLRELPWETANKKPMDHEDDEKRRDFFWDTLSVFTLTEKFQLPIHLGNWIEMISEGVLLKRIQP